MNQNDLNWIAKKIRDEFDEPKEIHQTDQDQELIERAERFGLTELAEQMRADLPFLPVPHIPGFEEIMATFKVITDDYKSRRI